VLLVDISGDYFNARWKPVYAKNLKLNLGVDNIILFQFQNQDQKPVNISGSSFVFRIIGQDGENLLYAKELVTLNAATGRAKVIIPAADTAYLKSQPASYSVEVLSGNLQQAVFTDDYAGARGVIDIVDSVFPAFAESKQLTIPTGVATGANGEVYSSVLETQGAAQTTMQLSANKFTGSITVQGSSGTAANTTEWYDVSFTDLSAGNEVERLSLVDATSDVGINIAGYHSMVRLQISKLAGNISRIIYR
jgi:hypothetical protein